jgi:hypothetical protein
MRQEIPEEVQRQIEEATERFREELEGLYRWSQEALEEDGALAKELEERMRQWLREIGADTQRLMLGHMERYRRKGKQPCPGCGTEVYWKDYVTRQYISTLGELEIARVYYYDGACQRGWVPLDEQLGLGASELSPLVQEMASYLGGYMPFGRAQEYLSRYHDIQLSHDTVNAATVMTGQALEAQQAAAIAEAWATGELPECAVRTPPERLYVSADGIYYLQPNGEGREIKVAAIYETEERRNARGEREIHAINIEYVVARDPEELARAAYLTAVKRGAALAEEIIICGDGAKWIWNRITAMFPRAKVTEVGDFFHASEYLWKAAQAVWGPAAPHGEAWAEKQCHTLKHQGPTEVLAALYTLDATDTLSPEAVTKAITYFENQSPRMAYPDYIRRGLQIGSGSAESGVLQVVGARLNQPGMRWAPEHAEAVAHVRAAILSDRWDDFWADFQPPPRQYQRRQPALAA